jgi:hypothetical protein
MHKATRGSVEPILIPSKLAFQEAAVGKQCVRVSLMDIIHYFMKLAFKQFQLLNQNFSSGFTVFQRMKSGKGSW